MRLLLTMFLAVGLVLAAPQGKGKGKGQGKGGGSTTVAVYRIPQAEIVIVQDYYRETNLPPGLAKKLARGGSLPPGWQKKIQPVPVVLASRLAPIPVGYQRGIMDGVFVVYDSNRGLIIDIVASF